MRIHKRICCEQCVFDHMVPKEEIIRHCWQMVVLHISNSRSPISGNKKRVLQLGESTTYCIDVRGCVYVLTYSCLNLSVGRHQRMNLLHHAAGEVADASLLLSIIGVLYLQTDDIDKCHLQHPYCKSFSFYLWLYSINSYFIYTAGPEKVPSVL